MDLFSPGQPMDFGANALDPSQEPPKVFQVQARRPAALRGRLDDITDRATEAFARYLAARPEATVPDPAVAAALVVQVLEATTHGLVIHPRAGVAPEATSFVMTTVGAQKFEDHRPKMMHAIMLAAAQVLRA